MATYCSFFFFSFKVLQARNTLRRHYNFAMLVAHAVEVKHRGKKA